MVMIVPGKLALLCAWLLLIVALRLAASQDVRGEAGDDVAGEGETSVHRGVSPSVARGTVCQHSLDAYSGGNLDFYGEWLNKIRRYTGLFYFTYKPQTVPTASVCYGMNTTCCKPTAEKEIWKIARNEYTILYHETLTDSLQDCPHIGRKVYFALYKSFDEIRRQFEIDMNELFSSELPEDMFDHLFHYFNRFIFHPDLCDLEDHLELQIQAVADYVYSTVQRGPTIETERYPCFVNITRGLTSTYLRDIFTALESQLYKLRILVQTVQITEEVVDLLARHRFSPACMNALIRMKHCAYCGGFKQFRPCLYFCINTLQGCFADVAELHPAFDSLVGSLRLASNRFISQLQPETFIENGLHHFVAMTNSLKNRDLKGLMSTECESYEHNIQKRQLQQVIDSNIEPIELPDDGLSYDVFSTAMAEELTCMEELSSLLWNVPQEMCFLSKNHIANIGNEQCWTGIDMGSYDQHPLGKLKVHQVNNTAFSVLPLETEILYNLDIAKIRQITRELNRTILQDDDPCLQSDDEDCTSRPVYECDSFGSGSESGSGSGSTGSSGFEDMEGEATPSSQRPGGSVIDDLNDPSLEDFDNIWMENADNSRPFNRTQFTPDVPGQDRDSETDGTIEEEEEDETNSRSRDGSPGVEILKSTMPEVSTDEFASRADTTFGSVVVLLVSFTAVAAALAA